MVQIQSSWFPLWIGNPQRFVDIYSATPARFPDRRTQRIYHSPAHPSHLNVFVLP